jgi:hypothetical protein
LLSSYIDQDGEDSEEEGGDPKEERGNQTEEIGNVATSRKKKVRGLTRLVKMHKEYEDSKGEKHVLEFDKWGRLTGKYRA